MQIQARLNHLRLAPRKVRLLADMIRRKKVEEAQAILSFTAKRASQSLLKLLNSAVANAKNSFQLESANLYISKIIVDEGPKIKRWKAGSRGRAFPIQKKTSHIILILEEIKPTKSKHIKGPKRIRAVKEEKPVNLMKEEEIDIEKKERDKAREALRKERKPAVGIPKPKERGGIRRMFRRKSF